jgi:hypothetical protein
MYDVFNESRWKNKCILLRAMKQPAFRDILWKWKKQYCTAYDHCDNDMNHYVNDLRHMKIWIWLMVKMRCVSLEDKGWGQLWQCDKAVPTCCPNTSHGSSAASLLVNLVENWPWKSFGAVHCHKDSLPLG